MRTRRRLFRVWHRRIGLISCAFLLWIAVTGLLLNHTETFGLQGPTRLGHLAQWIGIDVRCEPESWPVSAGVLVFCENGLYLDEQRIADLASARAVVEAVPWIVALSDTQLWVFDTQGRLADMLALPTQKPARSLHGTESGVVLRAGAQAWQLDAESLELLPTEEEVSSLPVPLPVVLNEQSLAGFATRASGEALSWTKLLQELHSGRVLAHAGPLLLDLAGISLILLAVLGIVIDVRRSHAGSPKQ